MTPARPYSYRDVDGDRLAVFTADIPGQGRGVNIRTDPHGCSIPAEDVPALVRAILAAGGSTGHEVLSVEEIGQIIEDSTAIGARYMRERALQAISDAWGTDRTATELISDLPLIPD